LGSEAIVRQDLRAEGLLADRYDVSAVVRSVAAYRLLRIEAVEAERWNRRHPEADTRVPYITQVLGGAGPVIAASDFLKSLPDQIGRWSPQPFVPLGTDGFGRSDPRDALRPLFEVDPER